MIDAQLASAQTCDLITDSKLTAAADSPSDTTLIHFQ